MIFLSSVSSAAALVFYLPVSGPCTQRLKPERGQSPEYIFKFSKKTLYLMNTLYFRNIGVCSTLQYVLSPNEYSILSLIFSYSLAACNYQRVCSIYVLTYLGESLHNSESVLSYLWGLCPVLQPVVTCVCV